MIKEPFIIVYAGEIIYSSGNDIHLTRYRDGSYSPVTSFTRPDGVSADCTKIMTETGEIVLRDDTGRPASTVVLGSDHTVRLTETGKFGVLLTAGSGSIVYRYVVLHLHARNVCCDIYQCNGLCLQLYMV